MATKTPPRPATQQAQPPDEQFWVKYSRHYELPISGMASLAWHTLAIVIIVVVALVVTRGGPDEMPIEFVQLGGGGGDPKGVGLGPGDGRTSAALVEAASKNELPADATVPNEPLKDIVGIQINPRELLDEVNVDKDTEADLVKITERGTQTAKKLADLDARLRRALMGHGEGGPGSGGGQGPGVGPGKGPWEGPGGENARTKRKLRWTITFNTQSGGDYLRQLHALGAILAYRASDGELKCVKNLLERPVKPAVEDLAKLNRIFWIDDKRESVEQLARALGLDFVPDRIVALFPHEFEKELLAKELGFRNKKESEILETRFQILIRGNGYQVVVTDQRFF